MALASSNRPERVELTARQKQIMKRWHTFQAEISNAGYLDPQDMSFYAHYMAIAILGVADLWLVQGISGIRDAFLAGLLASFVSGLTGHLGHDAAHKQAPKRSKILMAFATWYLGNLSLGFSLLWWKDKHNQHHGKPNQDSTPEKRGDPDTWFGMLAFAPSQLALKSQKKIVQFVLRHQSWMFFCLLPFQAINARYSSVCYLFSVKLSKRILIAQFGGIALHLLIYGAILAHIWMNAGPGPSIVFAATHQAGHGIYNGLVFATNHKGRKFFLVTDFPSWFEAQVLSSRNVRCGGIHIKPLEAILQKSIIGRATIRGSRIALDFVVTWLYGGLNYQIEHHLFQTMPRCNLRKVRPLVIAFLEELRAEGFEEFEYYETGIVRAYAEVAINFKEVSSHLGEELFMAA